MKLSRTERWILSNQYKILERLYPEEAEHYREAREAIDQGYALHYDGLAQHVYDDDRDTMTEHECQEVVDILSMFRSLYYAKDKGGAEPDRITFLGFDGNNETKQMAYTRYFCKHDGQRFTELHGAGDDFNSHVPVLARYRRQLAAWRESANQHELTADDVRRIAAAARYPDHA